MGIECAPIGRWPGGEGAPARLLTVADRPSTLDAHGGERSPVRVDEPRATGPDEVAAGHVDGRAERCAVGRSAEEMAPGAEPSLGQLPPPGTGGNCADGPTVDSSLKPRGGPRPPVSVRQRHSDGGSALPKRELIGSQDRGANAHPAPFVPLRIAREREVDGVDAREHIARQGHREPPRARSDDLEWLSAARQSGRQRARVGFAVGLLDTGDQLGRRCQVDVVAVDRESRLRHQQQSPHHHRCPGTA